MEALKFFLNPFYFLAGFIPTLVLSFLLLKKYIFHSSIKTSKQLMFKVFQIILLEFLISIGMILVAFFLVAVYGIAGGLISVMFVPHSIVSCIIIAIIAMIMLIVEYKDKKYQFRKSLTRKNLILMIAVSIIFGLTVSFLFPSFYK